MAIIKSFHFRAMSNLEFLIEHFGWYVICSIKVWNAPFKSLDGYVLKFELIAV